MRGSGSAVIDKVGAAAVRYPLQLASKVIELVSGRFGATLLIVWLIKTLASLRWRLVARQAASLISVCPASFILGLA